MPFIQKRCIWWEPVAGATSYVVYVGTQDYPINPATFSWGDTPRVISKIIPGNKTEIVIPDGWPEFPGKQGTYRIAVTARDKDGNQSDPLFLSAAFNFVAPPPPLAGGIDLFPRKRIVIEWEIPEKPSATPDHSQTRSMIQQGMKQVSNNEELGNTYLGNKFTSEKKEIP